MQCVCVCVGCFVMCGSQFSLYCLARGQWSSLVSSRLCVCVGVRWVLCRMMVVVVSVCVCVLGWVGSVVTTTSAVCVCVCWVFCYMWLSV